MNGKTTLLELQKRQHEHDRGHHQDIFNISYPDRMNHYILHFSKYVGRLAKKQASEEEKIRYLEKTLADSFIVALASANTLNLNLNEELQERFSIQFSGLSNASQELSQSRDTSGIDDVQNWLFNHLATPTGRMSNAMESLDHMEPVNVRNILEDETVNIASLLLIASQELNTDLELLLSNRWDEIEQESIL